MYHLTFQYECDFIESTWERLWDNLQGECLKDSSRELETASARRRSHAGLIYLLALTGALETLMSFSAHFQLSLSTHSALSLPSFFSNRWSQKYLFFLLLLLTLVTLSSNSVSNLDSPVPSELSEWFAKNVIQLH